MNKVAIVKIAGFLVVPILVMLVVIYFLYPLLNSDKYEMIVRTNGSMVDSAMIDSLARLDSLAMADSLAELRGVNLDVDKKLEMTEQRWINKVDSLSRMIYVLNSRLEGLESAKQSEVAPQQANNSSPTAMSDEAFKERVKSLLNLEEDDMAPILEKMTKEQLVQLYREAGNTQREKILRALNSDRAAQLITEIML